MTNHTRSSHFALAALTLAGLSAACKSDPLAGTTETQDGAAGGTTGTTTSTVITGNGGTVGAGGLVDFTILAVPDREVDILFMIDNSPSMDPKQNALATNFPKLINVLKTIPDGSGGTSLPDVHIGVISSDMGSGSDAIGVNCSRILGDRGLLYGNDPNNPLASVAPNADPSKGGHPDPNGCGLHSGARWISDVADPSGNGQRIKNYDGNIQDVFSCLAAHVGVGGCGFEHQLQSVRVALNADYPANPKAPPSDRNTINSENIGFVRPKGYLAIVLITDEDDCSAQPGDDVNDSMFVQNPMTETASLRCAARGHVCNGQPIPGYSDPSAGYQPPNPLPAPNVGFSTAFSNCAAKDWPNPSNPDPHYLPLIRVQDMIDSVNGIIAWAVDINGNYVYDANGNHVSVQKTPDKILVSGIIGWPPDTALPGVTTSDQYQIGRDTTSLPAPQNTYWDYMPICTVPAQHSADGNIYKAYGGLRLKKFIDAFGANGQTFSICNQDFTNAMAQSGGAIAKVLKSSCVPYPLMDMDPNTPGIQPECTVTERIPCDMAGAGGCMQTGYMETPLSECGGISGSTSGLPIDPANPQVDNLPDSVRPCWYLYYDTDPLAGCADAPNGQRISVLRKTGETAAPGTLLALACMTCPASNPDCSGSGH